MGTYDSQMQRIHDTAKALDEAGQLEQRQRGGNMEHTALTIEDKLLLAIFHRGSEEELEVLFAWINERLTIATTHVSELETELASCRKALDGEPCNEDFVREAATMSRFAAECMDARDAATTRAEQAEAQLNDPIYLECCANLKKAEQQRDRLSVDKNSLHDLLDRVWKGLIPYNDTSNKLLREVREVSIPYQNERRKAEAALRETREGS